MNTIASKSLAEIVNDNHRAAGIFEKHHLDFCCNGKRTLEEACTANNLPIHDIITALEQTKKETTYIATPPYENLTLSQLADYIIAVFHGYTKNEMPVIAGYLQKVAAKHGDRHPEMKKVYETFIALKEELEEHMKKEEIVLFPRIQEIEQQATSGNHLQHSMSYLNSPINMMEHEHDDAGQAMAEIRHLTNNYQPPADACTTYRLCLAALEAFELNLHQHVHLENNNLFPKALTLFKKTDNKLSN
jgi:regulator of cell morphogenesis and NO signaling